MKPSGAMSRNFDSAFTFTAGYALASSQQVPRHAWWAYIGLFFAIWIVKTAYDAGEWFVRAWWRSRRGESVARRPKAERSPCEHAWLCVKCRNVRNGRDA